MQNKIMIKHFYNLIKAILKDRLDFHKFIVNKIRERQEIRLYKPQLIR